LQGPAETEQAVQAYLDAAGLFSAAAASKPTPTPAPTTPSTTGGADDRAIRGAIELVLRQYAEAYRYPKQAKDRIKSIYPAVSQLRLDTLKKLAAACSSVQVVFGSYQDPQPLRDGRVLFAVPTRYDCIPNAGSARLAGTQIVEEFTIRNEGTRGWIIHGMVEK